MTVRDALNDLIEEGGVATTLRQSSSARHAIAALQTLLHWLGFDRQLNWKKFGADGDYGNATVAAVAAFARRNGSTADGKRVSNVLAEKILARYDSLEELKQLADDIKTNRIERYYVRGGKDRIRLASLQTLLHDLGFDAELNWKRFGADGDYGRATAAAVASFAKRERLAGDGGMLTMAQAKRLVTRLRRFYGDTFLAPYHPPTPAPESLTVTTVIGNRNRQFLEVSDGTRKKRFGIFGKGLFMIGGQKPAAFFDVHADRLRALRLTASEINVMISVAENEGNLDAINTWDNAFLSFGLFQWTAGQGNAKGELPGLLARIKDENRDLFNEYCGQHGLDVAGMTPDGVRGYFSLRGTVLKNPSDKAQLRQPPWAFYFWRAGQDPRIQALEIKHAVARLHQFYSNDRYRVDNRYLVSDLVTSEYGVGLILDQHVNRPAHVRTSLAAALGQTGLPDPGEWDTEDERKLIDAYLRIRATTSMTDPEKRARVTKKYLTNGVISDRRGSFKQN